MSQCKSAYSIVNDLWGKYGEVAKKAGCTVAGGIGVAGGTVAGGVGAESEEEDEFCRFRKWIPLVYSLPALSTTTKDRPDCLTLVILPELSSV